MIIAALIRRTHAALIRRGRLKLKTTLIKRSSSRAVIVWRLLEKIRCLTNSRFSLNIFTPYSGVHLATKRLTLKPSTQFFL